MFHDTVRLVVGAGVFYSISIKKYAARGELAMGLARF